MHKDMFGRDLKVGDLVAFAAGGQAGAMRFARVTDTPTKTVQQKEWIRNPLYMGPPKCGNTPSCTPAVAPGHYITKNVSYPVLKVQMIEREYDHKTRKMTEYKLGKKHHLDRMNHVFIVSATDFPQEIQDIL